MPANSRWDLIQRLKGLVPFVVADGIRSPFEHSPRVKWYQAVRIAGEV